jgi:hypothetical protein
MKKTPATLAAVTAAMALNACSTTPETQAPAGSAAPSQSSAAPSSAAPSWTPSATTETSGQDTAVTITAGDHTFDATINDSQVSQDFLATLPTMLSWDRNAGIEYIAELDEPMTETGPFYTDVEAGDIVYYNPMDSITIIYAPTSSVPTLTKMGEVTSDLATFEDLPDSVDMRIELQG